MRVPERQVLSFPELGGLAPLDDERTANGGRWLGRRSNDRRTNLVDGLDRGLKLLFENAGDSERVGTALADVEHMFDRHAAPSLV